MTRSAAYVSYAKEDASFAGALCEALKRAGTHVASTHHGAPDNELDSTMEAIAECRVLVVLYSRHANASLRVTREVEFAAQHEIPILPVRLEDVPMSRELEFYLSAYHWLTATATHQEAALRDIVGRIEQLVTQVPVKRTGRPQAQTPQTQTHRRPAYTMFATAVVSAVAVGGTALWFTSSTRTPTTEDVRESFSPNVPQSEESEAQTAIKTGWRVQEGEGILELPGGIEMKFVWCPPGTFSMGSPDHERNRIADERQHEVTLTRGFWIGKYEVTRRQWDVVMSTSIADKESEYLPVSEVSWLDCQSFIDRINASDAGTFRLPTEAEWEYACRAGTTTTYPFGDGTSRLPTFAHFRQEELDQNSAKNVDHKKPNAWEIYGMLGNVSEWTNDWYGEYPKEAVTDPTGPSDGVDKVIRGGNFARGAQSSLPAYRHHSVFDALRQVRPSLESSLTYTSDHLGFRLAADMPPPESSDADQEDASAAGTASGALVRAFWRRNGDAGVLNLDNGVTMEFVRVEPGSFTMGSPGGTGRFDSRAESYRGESEALHEVTLRRGFWIGKYEVTQEQWLAVMGDNPSEFQANPQLPVQGVSWNDCQEFISRVDPAGRNGFCLPSEAQWEYVCRAGNNYEPMVNLLMDEAARRAIAHFDADTTQVVGRTQPNEWGVYDMRGNVEEWCRDWFGPYPSGAVFDPMGPESGDNRVVRGGSYKDQHYRCRAAARRFERPFVRDSGIGFRLCKPAAAL